MKRYAKVEKIPGGVLEDCQVLDGVMFNKDVTHPNMRRRIENPRVVLLDCPLEYKKGESMTNMEFTKEEDFQKALEMEETEVMRMCDHILRVKPDIVITEKGVSDIAQHYLLKKGNISCVRRVRKTDNNRIARVTGATIANRPEELQESDVGTSCGLYEVKKIGDDYFTFMTDCKDPSACSIILRGASKDVLNEIERNLHDAMQVARNVVLEPKLLPGGGATDSGLEKDLVEVLVREELGEEGGPVGLHLDASGADDGVEVLLLRIKKTRIKNKVGGSGSASGGACSCERAEPKISVPPNQATWRSIPRERQRQLKYSTIRDSYHNPASASRRSGLTVRSLPASLIRSTARETAMSSF